MAIRQHMRLVHSAMALLDEARGPRGPVGLPGCCGPQGDGEFGHTGRSLVKSHISAIASTYRAKEINEAYYEWYVGRAIDWLLAHPEQADAPLRDDEVYKYIYAEGRGPPGGTH